MGTHGAAGKGLPCSQRPRGERERGDWAGAEEGFVSSLLLPTSSPPDRARGAALGSGQRFFVSLALSAGHCGGAPHPDGSGTGRFIQDINFSIH